MDSISISMGNTASAVSMIEERINSRLIGGAADSKKDILGLIVDSSGEFIDSLKEEIEREVGLIEDIGNLLITVAKYVGSATEAFAEVDQMYDFSKLMLP